MFNFYSNVEWRQRQQREEAEASKQVEVNLNDERTNRVALPSNVHGDIRLPYADEQGRHAHMREYDDRRMHRTRRPEASAPTRSSPHAMPSVGGRQTTTDARRDRENPREYRDARYKNDDRYPPANAKRSGDSRDKPVTR